jgi:hypothetical protein
MRGRFSSRNSPKRIRISQSPPKLNLIEQSRLFEGSAQPSDTHMRTNLSVMDEGLSVQARGMRRHVVSPSPTCGAPL